MTDFNEDDPILQKVQKLPCIVWPNYTMPDGYGMRRYRGKMELAHRVAWTEAFGEIPDGIQVLHECDNRPCIEPTHLFLGTNATNVADRHAKGRDAKGSRNGNAKLDEEKVIAIRDMARAGFTRNEMAHLYGVSWHTIDNVVNRVDWRHVS